MFPEIFGNALSGLVEFLTSGIVLFAVAMDTNAAAGTFDLSLGNMISENFNLTIGANNLLNTYPKAQFDGCADQGDFNESAQMESDGLYLFGRVLFRF